VKAIVTQEYADGTFADAGMNTRRPLGPLKTQAGLRKQARRVFPTGVLRIEYFHGDRIPLSDPPFAVEVIKDGAP
jgi:hypothetical protein